MIVPFAFAQVVDVDVVVLATIGLLEAVGIVWVLRFGIWGLLLWWWW